MTGNFAANELDAVFGVGSTGTTPETRAATSSQAFVRSQLQLAFASTEAKGRIFKASEALDIFGWQALRSVGLDGYFPLLTTSREPATTLQARRDALGLTPDAVARNSGLTVAALNRAESIGERSPMRVLEAIAQTLALDERRLGFEPNARGDANLGVRLREMSGQGDVAGFTQATVLQLTEAAWVISRQHELKSKVANHDAQLIPLPRHDSRFGYPAYETGYDLARKTRALLQLDDLEPIGSVRQIIEDQFGIPLVQEQINQRFAGATLANGHARGIAINEQGLNQNVWVRRMTLCHELGHLLWDPSANLQNIKVDEYSELQQNERDAKRDPAEIRANAFAIAFLVPPGAVREIARVEGNIQQVVARVMQTFGISVTAARYHVGNVLGQPVPYDWTVAHLEPDQQWTVSENLMIDFFPVVGTPLSRRGRFAWYVAKVYADGGISLDTAASYLKASSDGLSERLERVLELWA